MGMQQPPQGLLGEATCGTGTVGSRGVVGAGPPNGIAGFGQGSYISITGDLSGHLGQHSGIPSTRHLSCPSRFILRALSPQAMISLI